MPDNYSLMIHGGAGALDHIKNSNLAVHYLESILVVLEFGREVLSRGGSALEAAESCCAMLEDEPLFNAGCGSVLNEFGKIEMDAALMDGRDLAAGAVAGIHNIANPILLARLVLARSEHVMLIGDGAMRFADHCGLEQTDDAYFLTKERIEQFEDAREKHQILLDHDEVVAMQDEKYGTVGAIAWDLYGNLAAGTSTGGIVNKRHGRVGDSPLIGAGVYADNETCAVSSTGYGEDFMRTVLAKTIASLVEFRQLDAKQAADEGIQYLTDKVNGRGGVIVVDREGRCASGYTTKRMIHGWIEHGGETICTF